MIGLAIIIALYLTLKEAEVQKINEDFFLDYLIFAIPLAIIGARLYYVIFRWDIYKFNPLSFLYIWEGGLAIHGALIAGVVFLFFFSEKRKVKFFQVLDIFAPGVILGQAIGRWGNFINQEAYGGIVSREFYNCFPEFIKKQMFIEAYYRAPTFLYESFWNIFVFIFLLLLRRRKFIKNGDIFSAYLILYSTGRFFIEGLRTDSLMMGEIRVARLISVLMILSGLIIIFLIHRKENHVNVK